MPVFHDPDLRLASDKEEKRASEEAASPLATMRRPSEESIRTEFCDGPEPEVPRWITALENQATAIDGKEQAASTSDRAELIKRIKSGESPTWVPSEALKQEIATFEPKKDLSPQLASAENQACANLLPPAEISGYVGKAKSLSQKIPDSPNDIQRPRSALHSGDFTEGTRKTGRQRASPSPFPSPTSQASNPAQSPSVPWHVPSLPWQRRDIGTGFQHSERYPEWADRRPSRSRAPSLQSYSSSYVLKAPTTPLVQQSNNEDLDFSDISPVNLSESPSKSNRRHTLPPNALPANAGKLPPATRRIASSPYQGHRPRRSLTSTWSLQSTSSPVSPRSLRSRKPSFSSETGSIQHASMVGSYEESILRGWMSTPPSKPLDFTAQIGVLGKGTCKPKCPAHVTVPFPAVFYSYGGGGSGNQGILAEPSPYVGHIDLQNLLPHTGPQGGVHKRLRSTHLSNDDDGHVSSSQEKDDDDYILQARKRKKRRTMSLARDLPPGGSYRIPQQGQLQIIIKNPNKTAVKLFLVPYDLSGMEAGTKTFIRQRCYSAGASIDNALSSNSERPKRISIGLEPSKKPTLRYLIHVNICCPSKGRFYLYQHIRVVFANRVPDSKEQLQNEIQLPQPRYSPYRASRESLTPSSNMGVKLAAEKTFRRRSSGFGYEPETLDMRYTRSVDDGLQYPRPARSPPPPVPAIPFDFALSPVRPSKEPGLGYDGALEVDDSTIVTTTTSGVPSASGSNVFHLNRTFSGSTKSSSSNSSDGYTKLNKGDNGYGGLFGRPSTPEPGEGLLARRLRGLGLRREDRPDEESI